MKPQFGSSRSKSQARIETIIKPWREQSGRWCIPGSRHYLTLAGTWAGETSEPRQLEATGLVSMKQMMAAESDRATYVANIEMGLPCRLFYGDLVHCMQEHVGVDLDPAIVNLDTMSGPKQARRLLEEALIRLNELQPPQMVVWNVVASKNLYQKDYRKDFQAVEDHAGVLLALDRGGWRTVVSMEYSGAHSNRNTTMRSYTLWRSA